MFFANILKDASIRSLLCHKVSYYQALTDILQWNYVACVTSLIPLYHIEGQVEAKIYY